MNIETDILTMTARQVGTMVMRLAPLKGIKLGFTYQQPRVLPQKAGPFTCR